ncbi:hypothetical protein A1D31_30195 [Bradyrhizobium liaoningense]|nr:hypothetical protein A1D31_30195 [Bradyrhizobium liaoningense]
MMARILFSPNKTCRADQRRIRTSATKSNDARGLRLKPGPLHLAAIVLMHLACMSLIVWLSF